MFSSRSFIVSGLTFRALIHFEFIFVHGVRKCYSFILLQADDQFSQHHLLKILSFHHCIFFPPLSTEPSGELTYRYMFVYTHAYCMCLSTYMCTCIYSCWNDFQNCTSDGVSATFVCLVVYEDLGRTMRETWGKRSCVNGEDANGGVDWKWKLQKCYMQNVVLHSWEGAVWIPDDYKLQIKLFIPSSCCLNDFHKPNCCPGY